MRISRKTPDELIYQARWILYPVHLALMVAASIFLLHIVLDTGLLVDHCGGYILGWRSGDDLMISVVRLLEEAMTEWLLVSIIMGGHQIYITRSRRTNGPQWLEHIDTVTMKIKVGLAFVGYSSAKLLEDIIASVPFEVWIRHIVTHCVFLFTVLLVAMVHRLMRARP